MTTSEIGSIYGPRVRTTRQRINFWHGIDWEVPFETMWELVQQRQRWVRSHYGVEAFEDKPLPEGFAEFDLTDGGMSLEQYVTLLSPRDFSKLKFVTRQQAAEHATDHFVRLRPYCPECRGSRVLAELSLASWLVRHPGRLPDVKSDMTLGWDTETVLELPPMDQAELYMDLRQLNQMPLPHDLIEGIIPAKGVGYITGRDRSLKTFLGLDMLLHVGCMYPFWHEAGIDGTRRPRRKVGFNGEGKVIFAAGEGVTSFAPRVQAWEKAQHVKGWPLSPLRTVDNAMAVRDQSCSVCQGADDDLVGHVHHVAFDENGQMYLAPGIGELETSNITVKRGTVNLFAGGDDYRFMLALARRHKPDMVILDTLALSSGAADQQSNSEMGEIHARAAMLAEASGGVVLLIAHTDKGDNDARGASVIEDNADFVLHCTRVDNDQLKVEVAKRKDAADNWHFMLAVEEIDLGLDQTSLILKDWDAELYGSDEDPEADAERAKIREAAEKLVVDKRHNLFDAYEFAFLDGMNHKTASRALDRLVESGDLVRIDGTRGRGQRTRYHFPSDWMAWQKTLGHDLFGHDEDPLVSDA